MGAPVVVTRPASWWARPWARPWDRPFAVLAGSAGVGLAVGFAAGHEQSLALMLAAVAGVVLLRRPATGVLALLLFAEEIDSSSAFGRAASRWARPAPGTYYAQLGGFRLLVVVLAIGLGAVVVYELVAAGTRRLGPWTARTRGVLIAMLMVNMVLALRGASRAGAGDLLSSFKSGLPIVVLLLGFGLGASVVRDRREVQSAQRAAAGVLLLKAAIALMLAATGAAVALNGVRLLVYYDAALPAAAAAVMVAALVSRRLTPGLAVAAGASLVVVVFSFRRSVWVSLLLLVAFVTVANWRAPVRRRLLLGALAALTVVGLAAPRLFGVVERRASAVTATLKGTGNEASTQAHLSDLRVGWRYVRRQGCWSCSSPSSASAPCGC